MRRLGLRRASGALAAALAAALWGATPALAGPIPILPREQVRPGMLGVGRTVFEGTRIEEFTVEILGVLENVGPKHSLIIARLTGGPLEKAGVMAGMSGSPVFIDGRLVGAVSYGFPFSKETIAGLTPIGEMIEATRTPAPARAASARFPSPFPLGAAGAGSPARPLDREALAQVLRRPLPQASLQPGGWRGGPPPGALAAGALQPLALPLTFSGFDPAAFEWARGLFAGAGFAPLVGSGSAALPGEPLPDLEPGSPIGISLVEGDLDLSVTGTVTLVDDGRVYAFGHPFYNLGPTQFPLRKAYVFSVLPSLYQSSKISAPAEIVGTLDQDRLTAVAGRLGSGPRMIPVEVKLQTSRGQERRFAFRVVDDELFTPVLAYASLLSVLQGNERAFGTSTMRVEARLALEDGREVRVEDLFTRDQPAAQAALLVAAPLAHLMANAFAPLRVDRLSVDVASFETIQGAELQRAWLERDGPVRPGATLALKLAVRTYRGETRIETVPVPVPASAPAGAYTLVVGDAATLNQIEQREMRQAFVPRSVDQLLRAINTLRRNNRIYVRLMRPAAGAVVAGEVLPALPPSMLAVLGSGEGSAATLPLASAPLWDLDLPVDYAFSGSRALSFTVTR